MSSLIYAIAKFVKNMEANREVVARSLSAYERVMTTDQQAGKAWSEKLNKLINTLGTTKVGKPRPGPLTLQFSSKHTLIDVGVG